MTPGIAIRKHCIEFVGSPHEIKNCRGDFLYATERECPFYKFRMGKGRPSVKLIRKYCLTCMIGSYQAVNQCNSKTCKLRPFRMGKNPNYKIMNEERENRAWRINKYRENGGLLQGF